LKKIIRTDQILLGFKKGKGNMSERLIWVKCCLEG